VRNPAAGDFGMSKMRSGRRLLGLALSTLVFVIFMAGWQAILGGEPWAIVIAALIFGGVMAFADRRWNIFEDRGRRETRRIVDDLVYATLLSVNPMFMVLSTQHWHPAAIVAALMALALVGAALMTLAERYHEHRLGSHGYRAIPARRCILYALAVVVIAAALTTTVFVLPPLVFAMVMLAHLFAVAWVLGALEERRWGRAMDAEGQR